MCGIAGIINGGNAQLLERMSDIIAHRGPDDAGLKWFAESSSGLAQRRLSIIDLSPAGHQPMPNEIGDLWIVFNGEIYNYKEIGEELSSQGVRFRSHSDTEILLAAYQQWGEDCLQKLNGMFAFAIYDTRKKKLLRRAIVWESSRFTTISRTAASYLRPRSKRFSNRRWYPSGRI
jgi:asparagine synthase (glutamine-hydrolysing)